MPSPAEWIGIVITLIAAAVGYGALQAQVAALRDAVKELRASSVRQGERLGVLEKGLSVVEKDVDRELSRPFTGPGGGSG